MCHDLLVEEMVALKRAGLLLTKCHSLSTLTTDATGKLDVFGHDGYTLGVDGAQVGVLEETYQVSFASLLKGHDGRALEAQLSLEVLGYFTDQTLEGQLADEKLGALLVATDLTESHSTGPVTMGLLDTTGCWCRFASCLGGQLLAWSLTSSRFTCGLLCTCHFLEFLEMMIIIPNSMSIYTNVRRKGYCIKYWRRMKTCS